MSIDIKVQFLLFLMLLCFYFFVVFRFVVFVRNHDEFHYFNKNTWSIIIIFGSFIGIIAYLWLEHDSYKF